MPIRTVLIDDEFNNNESLKFMLETYCSDIQIVGIAEDIVAGEKLLKETEPDLVFLDIEMPYGNGFDLLNKVSPVNFATVFVTAFDTYAIQAIKYSALDYILKPVNINDLKQAVEKATAKIEKKTQQSQVQNLLSNLGTYVPGSKKIALPAHDGIVFEKIDNITYLAASSNYTLVHTAGKEKYTVARTLKEFEELLPTSLFSRIHHSFIVNLGFVKKYYKGRGGYVELEDGTTIEVSARKKDEFLARFG